MAVGDQNMASENVSLFLNVCKKIFYIISKYLNMYLYKIQLYNNAGLLFLFYYLIIIIYYIILDIIFFQNNYLIFKIK